MAKNRYSDTQLVSNPTRLGTSRIHLAVKDAVTNNLVSTETYILKGFERLDTIAGRVYGDSGYWWIIAAASDIGWGLQVPPGTVLTIPNFEEIKQLI
jgi:nucleoid-associated protein YgaU